MKDLGKKNPSREVLPHELKSINTSYVNKVMNTTSGSVEGTRAPRESGFYPKWAGEPYMFHLDRGIRRYTHPSGVDLLFVLGRGDIGLGPGLSQSSVTRRRVL